MKKLFAIALISFLGQTLWAQQAGKAVFDKTVHDFGQIKEEVGPVTVRFEVSNEGSAPLTLNHVQPSCGCTTPSWTKEPIAAGGKGFVDATYNPANRPGGFNKSITVRTDGTPEVMLLRITGEVTPKPKGVADWYPMEDGNLRFKSSHIAFGAVMHDGADTASTILYNQGVSPITLDLASSEIPEHITLDVEKTVIAPNEAVKLSFTYNAAQVKDWGYLFTNFELVTDDSEDKTDPSSPPTRDVNIKKRINISADIRENFTGVAASDKLPIVDFDKIEHDFGTVALNSVVNTTFTIKNNGEALLKIRKTKASCGCTASKPQKTELAPGESTTLDVSFTSGTSARPQKKSITVITNDPGSPVNTLWIKADVKEETSN